MEVNPDNSKRVTLVHDIAGTEPAGAKDSGKEKYTTIDGKPRDQYLTDQRDAQARHQRWCLRQFSDLRTQQALKDQGAIMLLNTYQEQCLHPATGPGTRVAPPDPPPNPHLLAAQAITRLTLPAPVPMIGPDPAINPWNMAVVNHPYWLWVQGPTQLASAVSIQGHRVALTATRTRVEFATGDGTRTTCTTMTPWVRGIAAHTPSPGCGHTYRAPSKPHYYRLRALTTWQVTWSVLGHNGTLTLTTTASRQLLVGQLTAVLIPNP